MSGALAYHSGFAAEEQVAAHYAGTGRAIAARRWRGTGGEIDLVARDGAAVIFIEVKKSRSHAEAAQQLTGRQIGRIYASASEYIAREPAGQDTEVRFDLALVDEIGRIDIIQNAFGMH